MKKKRFLLFFIGIFSIIGVFGFVKNSMAINKVRDSAISEFIKVYRDTVKVIVKYDLSGMNSGYESIEIKDSKMISSIISMIEKSVEITDKSKINNMSGMATKNNTLSFVTKNGSKGEIKFAYDDPAFGLGYLEIDSKAYDPGFSFFRFIDSLKEFRRYDTNIDKKAKELFKKYSWTVDYKINTLQEKLPTDFKYDAGEFPIKIYWAYNNALSKNVGLDYRSYLGKAITAEIYRLREPLPKFLSPRVNARGIVLSYKGKIIGAYIDAGRHNCFACSLDRRSLEDITKKNWSTWISEYINYNNALEKRLSGKKPEDIIKIYYDALNRHDEKTEFACFTIGSICNYLASNMDNNQLINKDFKSVFEDGEQNVKSVKLMKIRGYNAAINKEGDIEYVATADYKFKKEIVLRSGEQMQFIILRKETTKSGWKIVGLGTGP